MADCFSQSSSRQRSHYHYVLGNNLVRPGGPVVTKRGGRDTDWLTIYDEAVDNEPGLFFPFRCAENKIELLPMIKGDLMRRIGSRSGRAVKR